MIVGFEQYKNNYRFNVTGIIHVGAHIGQEYDEYVSNFGHVTIHWFEPVPFVFGQLAANIGHHSNNILYNFALGNNESISKINIDSGNEGQSSSILKPKEHINQFPHIKFEQTNTANINVRKLDNLNIQGSNMMVLDTQGYELEVLRGSTNTLGGIDYIFTEFNTIEMYEGCPTIEQIDQFLIQFGFERRETWYTSQNWGDAFYIKTK